jgi:hypothetical protein
MRQVIDTTDLPAAVLVERRHMPNRRSIWRGGRRNADWMSRPIGAWRHLEQRLSPWRHWIGKLPLPGLSTERHTHQ